MEEQIQQLKAQLAEKDGQLQLAGKLGSEVLERYKDVCDEMEKIAKEHATEIEKLEQEKYELNLKLEQRKFSECTYLEEVESLKETMRKEREEFQLKLDTVNQSELISLRTQLSSVREELEKVQLNERQVRDRNSELESLLGDVQERLKQKINMLNETTSEEIASLHGDMSNLQNDKMALMKELGKVKDECEHVRLQMETYKQQVDSRSSDIEQQQCQITSYYNALEKARDEIKELKAEIDLLRMETQDQKKKGNSLFSEVEDRRIEAEKQLISMRVQFESLKKHSEATRQQLQRLKMHIAGLLQMSGRQADSEHIERLETQLVQARGEVDSLTIKLHKLDKEKKSGGTCYNVDMSKQFLHSEDKHYIQFLKALLEKKEKELADQQKELDGKSFMLVAESDKLMQSERKLYACQRQIQTLQAQCIKLNVRLEELTSKYEPDKLQSGKKVRKTITEKIPLAPSNDAQGETEEQKNLKKTEEEKQRKIIQNLQTNNLKRDSVMTLSVKNKELIKSKTFTDQVENKLSPIKNHEIVGKSKPEVTQNEDKQPLKAVSTNTDKQSIVSTEELASDELQLKSIKVRKVSIVENADVIKKSRYDLSHQVMTENKEEFDKNKKNKPKQKIVNLSDEAQNECQTQ